jgi:hypothetical protein
VVLNPLVALGKYLACCLAPPTLSPKTIKNLGVQFCDMDPAALTKESLKKKKKVKVIVKGKKGEAIRDQDANGAGGQHEEQEDKDGKQEGPRAKSQAKDS